MSRRDGFTLVELMVAITILIILTTLVLAAFQRDDGDRLNAGARLIQAKIEGARSLAISENQIRGIRFYPNQNDPRTVTAMAYVGASGYADGTLNDIRQNIGDDTIVSDDFWEVQCATGGYWDRLLMREFIEVGSRIEIPAGSGAWYTFSDDNFDPSGNVCSLNEHYDPSRWVSDSTIGQGGRYDVPYARDTTTGLIADPIHYRLELRPTLLPNHEPMTLPRGVCIDMDASGLPSDWYATGDYWEITFDPRGNPTSPFGVVSLYVTTVGDVELTRSLIVDHPANGTPTPLSQPVVPGNAPQTPQNEPFLVVVYGQTGLVTTTRANLADTDVPQDFRANDPFSYAVRGREAQ